MKTNYVPAIVMLLAGAVYCLFAIKNDVPLMDFMVQLLIVLMVFFVLGAIVRLLLDHVMNDMADKAEENETDKTEADRDSDGVQNSEAASSEDEEGM